MEWTIPVNNMLVDDITKLTYTLVPPGCQGDVRSVRLVEESIAKQIDSLGEQSAAAQGLSKVITTAEKFRKATSHLIYLLKDSTAKNGNGEIIGFLKVAFKRLYLFDERDQEHQVEPLCVLDFFVSGTRQRRGNGKRLFDYMLQDTGCQVQDLAIDGPSPKMESFLAKNYGIVQLMRQSNNFAVSPAIFVTLPDSNKSSRAAQSVPTATAAVGRFTARKPPSSISDIIHGQGERVFVDTKNGTPVDALGLKAVWPGSVSPNSERPTRASSPNPERLSPAPLSPNLERRSPAPLSPNPEQLAPAPVSPNPEQPTSASVSPSLERPTSLPVAPVAPGGPSPAGSTIPRRDSQLTDQGYFDIKFYHNKLW